MAQAAYAWPDREFNAAQYAQSYVSADGSGPDFIYGPGDAAAVGYEPFRSVRPGVAAGSTTRALIVGGKLRAVRIAFPAAPS